MIRYFSLMLILFSFSICKAQDFEYKRDFEKILRQSKDVTSELYYPKLLKRFNDGDSTLSNYDVIALMIGFTENENYKPYNSLDQERTIMDLVSGEKYQQAVDSCNALLEIYPVNFTALEEKGFALWKLKNDSNEFHRQKCLKIVRAIKFSGDGSYENPMFVLGPADGQVLIRYIFGASIGSMGSGHDKNGYFVDILEMKEEGKEPRKLYFNIDHAMNHSEFKKEIDKIAKELEEKGVKFEKEK